MLAEGVAETVITSEDRPTKLAIVRDIFNLFVQGIPPTAYDNAASAIVGLCRPELQSLFFVPGASPLRLHGYVMHMLLYWIAFRLHTRQESDAEDFERLSAALLDQKDLGDDVETIRAAVKLFFDLYGWCLTQFLDKDGNTLMKIYVTSRRLAVSSAPEAPRRT